MRFFPTEKQPCYPNPCKHNGTCIETDENSFMCDCDDVGYTGETCDVLLIDVPEFSALAVNSPVEVSISSYPDREFMLHLEPDDRRLLKVNPKSMMFSQEHTHHNVTMKAKKPGKYILDYVINDQTLNYQPISAATLLVINGTVNKSDYFDKHGVKPGLLQPGCCSSEKSFHIPCSSSVQLNLKSTCGWSTDNPYYSPGIIFSSDNKFDMPVAIAGAKVRVRKSDVYVSSLSKDEFESDCNTCSNAQCSVTPISLNDVQSFLCHESLATTYFHYSSKLTPKWLKLDASSSDRFHDLHSYIVDLMSSDYLKTISECNKFKTVTDGLYSVMLYSGSLKVKINKESIQLQSNGSSTFCFAVNLCKGALSPLYIAIPDEAQTVVESLQFMSDLKSKGWSIAFNSLVISDSQISNNKKSDTMDPVMYWNGKEFFTSSRRSPNMITSVKFNKQFSNNDTVKVNWVFAGNVAWLHDNINKVIVSMYVCMHTYIYACSYVCTYAHTYICMHVRTYTCTYIYLCMYACMYVCICMYVSVICIHIQIYSFVKLYVLYIFIIKYNISVLNCVFRHLI